MILTEMNATRQNAMPRRPELLAPAGDWDAMRAATLNGADAVYFGLRAFNARHRAANFTTEDLPRIIAYLHGHNVRGFVTFNILVFSDELEAAAAELLAIARAGADAIIVQDLGILALATKLAPELELHASTQMTLTDAAGVAFVQAMGVRRAVMARELSIAQIGAIHRDTGMALEVFVHGALCVAYSGQCLTSESIGGRSANRGQCAQACRLPYELFVDGAPRDLADISFLVSPKDLAAHDLIADMTREGVASFKIEGRLKSPHYVAATTQVYRAAIDAAIAGKPFAATQPQIAMLEQTFSRGFSHGFLDGVDHQRLVDGRTSKSRGICIGTVARAGREGITVRLAKEAAGGGVVAAPGDGFVIDAGTAEQPEIGGRAYAVRAAGAGEIVITFGREADFSRTAIGARVWKTHDPALTRALETTYSRDTVVRRVPINAVVNGRVGEALRVTVTDDANHAATAQWPGPLEAARKHPLTPATFREQFGRLGDTPFELANVTLLDGQMPVDVLPVMAPKSVLNELRREAIEQLNATREATRMAARHPCPDALEILRQEAAAIAASAPPAKPALHALCRTMEQLRGVLGWHANEHGSEESPGFSGGNSSQPNARPMVYCDFEDVRRYPEAVALARAADYKIALATLRVIKPEEQGLLRVIANADPDAVLARNLSSIAYFTAERPDIELIADYSLNIANELSAMTIARAGAARMTPSFDLNWRQMRDLFGRFDPAWFEVVCHQHMPMFHMEHCVFAHTLSNGKDYRDCGRPCEKHAVSLRDRAGAMHPLLPDTGCRNTLFNADAQSAAQYVPEMLAAGIRHFRVELLRETAEQSAALMTRYARLLAGQDSPPAVLRQLRVLDQLGVVAGTLEHA